MKPDKPLKAGTLNCPKCKKKMEFRVLHTMRIITDGCFDARCVPCDKQYRVKHADSNS